MTVSSGEIEVEVTVPAPDPEPETPETPAVVVVEAPPAAEPAPDGLLAVLLEMKAEQTRQAGILDQVSSQAWTAEYKADEALANDEAVIEIALGAAAAAEEAAIEEQAPAEADEAPARKHWLHR